MDPIPHNPQYVLTNRTKSKQNTNLQIQLMNMRAYKGELDGIIGLNILKAVEMYHIHCPHPDTQTGVLDEKTIENIREDFQNGKTIYTCQHTL